MKRFVLYKRYVFLKVLLYINTTNRCLGLFKTFALLFSPSFTYTDFSLPVRAGRRIGVCVDCAALLVVFNTHTCGPELGPFVRYSPSCDRIPNLEPKLEPHRTDY